jgi:hypothetical protein
MLSPARSECNFGKGAATFCEDLHYHRDGQFEPPTIGSLSPLHASEFQGIFMREDDVQWDFNAEPSFNGIAAEGLGLGLSSQVSAAVVLVMAFWQPSCSCACFVILVWLAVGHQPCEGVALFQK